MQIGDIDLSTFSLMPHTAHKMSKVYEGPASVIKLWPDNYLWPHMTFDGLSNVWNGYCGMTSHSVGMIVPNICPAFVELIYDNQRCCGYVMKKCAPLSSRVDVRMVGFIQTLVLHLKATGYLFCDVHASNIMQYGGSLSVIDLDPPPVKISSYFTLTSAERKQWVTRLLDLSSNRRTGHDYVSSMYWSAINNLILSRV